MPVSSNTSFLLFSLPSTHNLTMKTVACLIALAVCAVIVSGEECQSLDECAHESCDDGYDMSCDRGECTCDLPCLYISDCVTGDSSTLNPDADDECPFGWHCYDNKCACAPIPGVGGGPFGK